MALIIDIETTNWFKDDKHKEFILRERQHKGLKNPVLIEENRAKIIVEAALSPYTGQITIAGLRKTDEISEIFKSVICTVGYKDPVDVCVISYQTEKDLLGALWKTIKQDYDDSGKILVGFSSKTFDLPFMFVRSLINNVNPGIDYLSYIHPYNNTVHLDLKSLFDKGSLKEIAYALNCQTENETKGYELPELWKTNPGAVVEKCKSDLIQTEKIYERVKEWIPQKLQMFSSSERDIIG